MKRKNAEWGFGGGPYRSPGTKPPGDPSPIREHKPTAQDLINQIHEEIMHRYRGNPAFKAEEVVLSYEDYYSVMEHLERKRYYAIPPVSSAAIFEDGQMPSPQMMSYTQSTRFALNTVVGPVEIVADMSIKDGKFLVVERPTR
jgi:hypothetical protein